MGTIVANTIIGKVEADLNDETNDRWEATDHLAVLNEGQRVIVELKPDAYVVDAVYRLAAGTKQGLPDGTASYPDPYGATLNKGIVFQNGIRNMGTDGKTPGDAVEVYDRKIMDKLDPGWHSATASGTVEVMLYDPNNPDAFYNYPPQPETQGSREWQHIEYSAVPDEAASASPITLDDAYELPLIEYMKYRDYAKNAHHSTHAANLKQYHWNQFVTLLDRKDLAEKKAEPVKK